MLDRARDMCLEGGSHPPAGPAAPRASAAYLAERHGATLAALCADELRDRHPKIAAAAAAGDLETLKSEAHALRGVAANFGLGVLAEQLLVVEIAARQSDPTGLTGALRRLPAEVAQALVALGQDALAPDGGDQAGAATVG